MGTELELSAIQEIVKAIQHPIATWHKAVNTTVSIILIIGCVVVGYLMFNNNKIAEHNSNQIELLNKYYVIQSQQTILLKIIDQNLRDNSVAKPGSAPMGEKVAVAKIIYDLATLKQIPISLLCGIAEVESSWNTHAVSDMGCLGLIQVTSLYARPYLRENRIDYKKDIYFDPVVNCIVGISMLCDFQNECIEKGLTTPNDFVMATHHYFWGPAKRDNKLDMNYSLKIIEAMKRFQKLGLT